MNPYYVLYCQAHNRTTDEQMSHDEELYPGGIMCGFLCWISEKKVKFLKEFPKCCLYGSIADYGQWHKFLSTK